MTDQPPDTLTRRALLATAGKATVVAVAAPFMDLAAARTRWPPSRRRRHRSLPLRASIAW